MKSKFSFKKPNWIDCLTVYFLLELCVSRALSLHLSICGGINTTSYSVVNGHTAVHHLNQSSQAS